MSDSDVIQDFSEEHRKNLSSFFLTEYFFMIIHFYSIFLITYQNLRLVFNFSKIRVLFYTPQHLLNIILFNFLTIS